MITDYGVHVTLDCSEFMDLCLAPKVDNEIIVSRVVYAITISARFGF